MCVVVCWLPVPVSPKAAAPPTRVAKKEVPTKPPRLELVKKRWFVEYQTGPEPIYLEDVSQDQEVYLYKCVDATIVINNKIKAMQVGGRPPSMHTSCSGCRSPPCCAFFPC